jgi:hypothetical protein
LGDLEVWGTPPNPRQEVSCTSPKDAISFDTGALCEPFSDRTSFVPSLVNPW